MLTTEVMLGFTWAPISGLVYSFLLWIESVAAATLSLDAKIQHYTQGLGKAPCAAPNEERLMGDITAARTEAVTAVTASVRTHKFNRHAQRGLMPGSVKSHMCHLLSDVSDDAWKQAALGKGRNRPQLVQRLEVAT